MPHGGGHFGGHHHGGGHHGGGGGWRHHHHGGGHFRHHHHRPYYNRGVVFTGWWFPWYYSGRRAYVGYGVWFGVFLLILLAVFLSTSLSTVDHHEGFNTGYSPLDTRLIKVSQTFCNSVELKNPSGTIPATAYVLSNGPSLTETHSFQFSHNDEAVTRSSYQYWTFYLHHGSSMNASICVNSGGTLEFYIIQGSSNFDQWSDGEDRFIRFEQIGASCPTRKSVSFDSVRNTDDYFFAFATGEGSSTVTFSFTMNFHRTEFEVVEEDVELHCSAGGPGSYPTRCTIDVPYNDEHYFLVATGNSTSSEGIEDGANVEWSCNARVWVYMLIFVIPPIFGLLIFVLIVIVCCCRQRKRNSRYSTLVNNDAVTTTTTTTYETTTTMNASPNPPDDLPPPYAPASNYSQQSPYPTGTGTGAYPPMPTAAYPPMPQNYGTTDKPTAM